MNIAQFPEFQILRLEDRYFIETISKKYPPYSDFNFVSLFSWDVNESIRISSLNDNLAIRFQDYLTGEPFYSLLGDNKTDSSIKSLLEFSKQKGIEHGLKLVPRSTIDSLREPEKFVINEDRDNFDYILNVGPMLEMKAANFRGKRSAINYFLKNFGESASVKPIQLSNPDTLREVENAFELWRISRNIKPEDCLTELQAIRKAANNSSALNILSIGLYIEEKLQAFVIGEISHHETGFIHFEKANVEYKGIFPYMNQQIAVLFLEHDIKYINYEQDLGIEGLRNAKLLYHPVDLLKKYTVNLHE